MTKIVKNIVISKNEKKNVYIWNGSYRKDENLYIYIKVQPLLETTSEFTRKS